MCRVQTNKDTCVAVESQLHWVQDRAHGCTNMHTHTTACTRKHTCITHIGTHSCDTHTHKSTHTHSHTYRCPHTLLSAHTHAHTYTHNHTHLNTHTHRIRDPRCWTTLIKHVSYVECAVVSLCLPVIYCNNIPMRRDDESTPV